MDVIKGEPTPGLTYNPNDPVYWDKTALKGEIDRVYEICHGCRLCFNLCPTFPELFSFIDKHDGNVRALTQPEHDRVIDTCYQCKLCYVKCPYTPDDGHPFQLDFPRLLLRANAVRKKEHGIGLRAKLLSHPEELGAIGSLTPGLGELGQPPAAAARARRSHHRHPSRQNSPRIPGADVFLLDEATARPARRHLASGSFHHLLRRLLQPASRQRRREGVREKRYRTDVSQTKLLRNAGARIRRRRARQEAGSRRTSNRFCRPSSREKRSSPSIPPAPTRCEKNTANWSAPKPPRA